MESEKKAEQHEFNTRFILKFLVFITFYRFFIMHIDPEEKLIKYIENKIFIEN